MINVVYHELLSFFVISIYNLLHFKNINISSTESGIRERFGCILISPLWEKCARDAGTHRIRWRVVSAIETAQVHKVYSVATQLDQNPAYAELQMVIRTKILNTVKYYIDNSFMSV